MLRMILLSAVLIGVQTPLFAESRPTLIDEVHQLQTATMVGYTGMTTRNATGVSPFAEGAWTFQTYGSAGFGDSKGEIYTAHAGFGYHFVDDLSINLEAIGGGARPRDDDNGAVGGFDLLFRWHFYHEGDWSIYMDGGAGFQQASTNFPSDSHHNFRPQFGLGLTYHIKDNVRLMAGARWLHISNAGTTDGNDGLDAAQLYAGLMWGF